jgi:hypothetical protein
MEDAVLLITKEAALLEEQLSCFGRVGRSLTDSSSVLLALSSELLERRHRVGGAKLKGRNSGDRVGNSSQEERGQRKKGEELRDDFWK